MFRASNLFSRFALFLFKVPAALFVFVTEHFEDVVIGNEIVGDFNRKGLRVHLGIVKGHFHF